MKKFLVALSVIPLIIISISVKAQNSNGLLTLIQEKVAFTPQHFYIREVIDERQVVKSIGSVYFAGQTETIKRPVNLTGGSFKSISNFLVYGARRDTSLRPLNLRLKESFIKETIADEGRVSGEITLVFSFGLEKISGPVHLSDFKTVARYSRPVHDNTIIESSLRKLLVNGLSHVNNWINNSALRDPRLAGELKLSFRDYSEQHDDTVYYDPARPLVWDDFREKRSGGRFAAAVFPSFGYEQHTDVSNGVIHVELAMKVFVVKSASWATAGAKSSYNLNHEQKHFELVKLIAERFKRKLLSEQLTPDNYQGIINFEYLEYYRQMNKIQEEYDQQTSHGMIASMQEYWNRKIENELEEATIRITNAN